MKKNKIINYIIWAGVYQDVCRELNIEPMSLKECIEYNESSPIDNCENSEVKE